MSKRIKDKNWVTVATCAATELSATFSTTPGTQVWLDTNGAEFLVFRLNSSTLTGAASEIRITPVFRSADGSTTDYPEESGTPVYYPLQTDGASTEPFGPIDAAEATAALWIDTTDATAAAVVQAKRIYPSN